MRIIAAGIFLVFVFLLANFATQQNAIQAQSLTLAPLPAPTSILNKQPFTIITEGTIMTIYANNYDNALAIYLVNGTTATFIAQALTECTTYGFNAVRTWATGTDGEATDVYTLWRNNTATFWSRFDAFIALCKAQNVKLIINLGVASFFTSQETGNLGDDESDAYALYVEWVTAICDRYKNEVSIAMWEVLNEYEYSGQPINLAAAFHTNAVTIIKNIDTHHPISSGSGNWGYNTTYWATVNTITGLDYASIHIYSDELEDLYGATPTVQEITGLIQNYETLGGKPLFIGEYGGDVEYSEGVTSNPDNPVFLDALTALTNEGNSYGFHAFASGSCTDTFSVVPEDNPQIVNALSIINVPFIPVPVASAVYLKMRNR